MAASIGIVPTLPHANQGESSRLLKDDGPLENVALDDQDLSQLDGVDFVPRLKKRVVWTYGIGETGVWASHVILGFYLNTFLLEVAGVSASNVRCYFTRSHLAFWMQKHGIYIPSTFLTYDSPIDG